MADTRKPVTEEVATPPKKKSKRMLFIIIGVVCLALAGGSAAFFMLQKPVSADGEDGAKAAAALALAKKKADPAVAPVFYKFDKAFTVKLQTEQQEAYLQTEIQLKLLDPSNLDVIKQYEPELKHRITLSLMNNKASTLATAGGVQRLANELRDVANKVVTPPAEAATPAPAADPAELAEADALVQSVLFSTFIIQ